MSCSEGNEGVRSRSASDTSSDDSQEREQLTVCARCHNKPPEFYAVPCGHHLFCRTCAMKCASGGKCKICNQFYGGLSHIA